MRVLPLPTRYAGQAFKSRTEARHAAFFDALELRWHYEEQGYRLPSGMYLPDFLLPGLDVWLEVKGRPLSPNERQRCGELQVATGRAVLVSVGRPLEHPLSLFAWGPSGTVEASADWSWPDEQSAPFDNPLENRLRPPVIDEELVIDHRDIRDPV